MILKNYKILVWIFFVVISIILIGPNFNPQGMTVTSVSQNTQLELSKGETLYTINDIQVTRELARQNYTGIVRLETSKGTKFFNANGSLGVGLEKVETTKIRFGLDIKGGVHVVIKPNTTDHDTVSQVISTLQTRINVFGLREAIFRPIYSKDSAFIEISIAGGTEEELKSLLEKHGQFEARVPLYPRLTDNKTSLSLDRSYDITVEAENINVNGATVRKGQTFQLADIDFVFNGIENRRLNLTATVFRSTDIVAAYYDPQRSRIERTNNGVNWAFGVQISPSGAQKFAYVTKNLNAVTGGYLDSPIELYLDNGLIDSLSISSSLKGRPETEIQITGSAPNADLAVQERAELQSILRSGALPASIEIVQLDEVSPTLGSNFINNALLAGAAAILAVVAVISIRYRNPKIIIPMIIISMSEVLIVLGISTLIGWTIDLAAIAAIIAFIGTGIDSQIIIIDQTIRGAEADSMRNRIKRAFFVVFGSAGTVIAAMLPLLVLGIGMLRGFAIVTIMGVLVGVLIARPAFGVIVERILK